MTDVYRELDILDDDDPVAATEPLRLTLAVDNSDVPDEVRVQRKATSFVELLERHQVTDDVTYLLCNDLFVQAATMLDEIDATFDPIIRKAHEAHKEACAQKAKYYGPVAQALNGLKQRFLAEKAKRDAAAERLRLEVEAQLRREAEEQKLAEAVALEDAGQHEEAALVFDEPTPPIHVPVGAVAHRVAPKLANTSTPGAWKCTKVDLKVLARAVADGKVPETYIEAAMPMLNARAKADKNLFNVPGCEATFVPTVRVRR